MQALIESMLHELSYFHPWPNDQDTVAIPYRWQPGKLPLCLVLGPNGSGKSFFRRLLLETVHYKWEGVESIHLSMEARSGCDTALYGPMRVMIYGNEATSSTGELSSHIIQTGIRTCQGRKKEHLIYWDEPDIGMGDSEAAGAGILLYEFMEALPEKTRAVFITTHSRALVCRLAPLCPHYLHLGVEANKAPQSLSEWLNQPIIPISPTELKEVSRARFKAIQAILNSRGKGQ